MKNLTRSVFFTAIVMILCSAISSASECTVLGLPENMVQKGDVYFLLYNVPSVKLTLQCRCSLFTPQWMEYGVSSQTFHTSTDPVHCVKNGEDCSPISYISGSNASPGFYLYQNTTVESNQSAVLTCSSSNDKLTVVVSLRDQNEDSSVNAEPTTTATTPVSPLTTSQLTVLPSPSTSLTHQTTTDIIAVTSSSSAKNSKQTSSLTSSMLAVDTSLSESVPVSTSVTTVSIFTETPNISGSDYQRAVNDLGTPALVLLIATCVLLATNVFSCACLLYMRSRHPKMIGGIHQLTSSSESIILDKEEDSGKIGVPQSLHDQRVSITSITTTEV